MKQETKKGKTLKVKSSTPINQVDVQLEEDREKPNTINLLINSEIVASVVLTLKNKIVLRRTIMTNTSTGYDVLDRAGVCFVQAKKSNTAKFRVIRCIT